MASVLRLTGGRRAGSHGVTRVVSWTVLGRDARVAGALESRGVAVRTTGAGVAGPEGVEVFGGRGAGVDGTVSCLGGALGLRWGVVVRTTGAGEAGACDAGDEGDKIAGLVVGEVYRGEKTEEETEWDN